MNLTLSVDQKTVEKARAVARRQGSSLNQMIRDYLHVLTRGSTEGSSAKELFALMDEAGGSLDGKRITRSELHER